MSKVLLLFIHYYHTFKNSVQILLNGFSKLKIHYVVKLILKS